MEGADFVTQIKSLCYVVDDNSTLCPPPLTYFMATVIVMSG